MKLGDLVICWPRGNSSMGDAQKGIIVGFNEKGEGGKEFVHVLCEGSILVFMSFDIEVVKKVL